MDSSPDRSSAGGILPVVGGAAGGVLVLLVVLAVILRRRKKGSARKSRRPTLTDFEAFEIACADDPETVEGDYGWDEVHVNDFLLELTGNVNLRHEEYDEAAAATGAGEKDMRENEEEAGEWDDSFIGGVGTNIVIQRWAEAKAAFKENQNQLKPSRPVSKAVGLKPTTSPFSPPAISKLKALQSSETGKAESDAAARSPFSAASILKLQEMSRPESTASLMSLPETEPSAYAAASAESSGEEDEYAYDHEIGVGPCFARVNDESDNGQVSTVADPVQDGRSAPEEGEAGDKRGKRMTFRKQHLRDPKEKPKAVPHRMKTVRRDA